MKMTLLEMVQDILNDIDSDEVNGIDDTVESSQVAQIIKSTYYALLTNRDWPHTRRLIQLVPSGDEDIPTHMSLQENIKKLIFINYDKAKVSELPKKRFETVKYLEQDDFLRYLNHRDSTRSNVRTIIDPSSLVPLLIIDDQPPTYFTSFDETTLVFDSYDIHTDSTLQASKCQAYAYVYPEWSTDNNFIPDLPEQGFPALLEEAKSRAALKLRQQADQKAEQEAQRQQAWLSRNDFRVAGGVRYPNYGRNPRGYPGLRGGFYDKDPTFRKGNK